MAVESTGSASRSAPLRLDDQQATAPQSRPTTDARSDGAAGGSDSAPLDPPVSVELSGATPPRLQPIVTRDEVSLGPLGDPEKMEEFAMALATRTREMLAGQTASLTNQSSQTILSLFPA
ncbi:hypothetical protein [Bosea sp. BK604]|uniref:hypothetical protein n=1 Tax=Bosea sp. BK604 TaxID=2512180 RepID=UPI00104AFD4E|nr:hypothetical protein [Bosea sp. BK604]TCR68792.1 hypothetical protein EV560_102622 [Bosea sp. BK604]